MVSDLDSNTHRFTESCDLPEKTQTVKTLVVVEAAVGLCVCVCVCVCVESDREGTAVGR